MKHIFYIHSYVTYLVTLGVVEHNDIEENDVILMTARGCVWQNRFKFIDINEYYQNLLGFPCYGENFLYIKKFYAIKSFDKVIANFCDKEPFVCYIPTDKQFIPQLLSSHPLCKEANFIEEGLFSYNDEYRKKTWPFNGVKGKIKRFLNTGNRNHKPSSIINTSTLFTLFETGNYSGPLSKKCVMPNMVKIQYDGVRLSNANILLMNAFRDASQAVELNLLLIIEKFAIDKKMCGEMVYIKHHPYSNENFRQKVESVFSRIGVNYVVLEEKLNTELMLFNSTNIKIYGFFSAAMLYGALMGHKVISFANCFAMMSIDSSNYLKNNFPIPEIFLKHTIDY